MVPGIMFSGVHKFAFVTYERDCYSKETAREEIQVEETMLALTDLDLLLLNRCDCLLWMLIYAD